MWVIYLEALAALLILIVIVWWTMFSGRKGGELARDEIDSRHNVGGDVKAVEPSDPRH